MRVLKYLMDTHLLLFNNTSTARYVRLFCHTTFGHMAGGLFRGPKTSQIREIRKGVGNILSIFNYMRNEVT